MKRLARLLALTAVLPYGLACNMFQVEPPPFTPANLQPPVSGARADLLIETVDLIDHAHPIGRVGDTFWGGQYQVRLEDSLDEYFEANVVQELQRHGWQPYRHPGPFELSRLEFPEAPPLHLRLELQELTFSRHPNDRIFSDEIVGVCKVRCLLMDLEGYPLYQRQFVGDVDTTRPTDELVLAGIGLISRAGLSKMLTQLLENTVAEVKRRGVPEILTVADEYRREAREAALAEEPTAQTEPAPPNDAPNRRQSVPADDWEEDETSF